MDGDHNRSRVLVLGCCHFAPSKRREFVVLPHLLVVAVTGVGPVTGKKNARVKWPHAGGRGVQVVPPPTWAHFTQAFFFH